jgi:mannitol-specific phosphotransferase system IIBC component
MIQAMLRSPIAVIALLVRTVQHKASLNLLIRVMLATSVSLAHPQLLLKTVSAASATIALKVRQLKSNVEMERT